MVRNSTDADDLLTQQRQLLETMVHVGDWKGTQLAKKAGLAPSTVNKVVNGSAVTVLTTVTLEALFKATRDRIREIGDSRLNRDELFSAYYRWEKRLIRGEGMPAVYVRGEVRAGLWQEAAEWPESQRYAVSLPVRDEHRSRAFGLEVKGRSMDREYPDGSIAICISYIDLGRDPRNKENVVCYRYNHDGLIEATIKKYVVERDGRKWLVPQSTDPSLQEPISLNGTPPGIDRLEIFARVIGCYKPEVEELEE